MINQNQRWKVRALTGSMSFSWKTTNGDMNDVVATLMRHCFGTVSQAFTRATQNRVHNEGLSSSFRLAATQHPLSSRTCNSTLAGMTPRYKGFEPRDPLTLQPLGLALLHCFDFGLGPTWCCARATSAGPGWAVFSTTSDSSSGRPSRSCTRLPTRLKFLSIPPPSYVGISDEASDSKS